MDASTAKLANGSVVYQGKTYICLQQAYCDNYGSDGGVRYYATAKLEDQWDDDADTYQIQWDTTESWDANPGEDESDACDWDNPVLVRRI